MQIIRILFIVPLRWPSGDSQPLVMKQPKASYTRAVDGDRFCTFHKRVLFVQKSALTLLQVLYSAVLPELALFFSFPLIKRLLLKISQS
jgi:hypothetical protein